MQLNGQKKKIKPNEQYFGTQTRVKTFLKALGSKLRKKYLVHFQL